MGIRICSGTELDMDQGCDQGRGKGDDQARSDTPQEKEACEEEIWIPVVSWQEGATISCRFFGGGAQGFLDAMLQVKAKKHVRACQLDSLKVRACGLDLWDCLRVGTCIENNCFVRRLGLVAYILTYVIYMYRIIRFKHY